VRVGPSADVTASKVVASEDLSGKGTTIDVSGAAPAQYVILWFTSLPKDGGKFRIEVSEVRLT
jgi:putative peptidoglycan lipid II flippase